MSLADRIAHLVVHRPKTLIAATLLVLGACAWLVASRQRLDSEVLNLLPPGSEQVQALKVFNCEFRQGHELIFALQGDEAVIADFEEHFTEKLRAEPWVERVFGESPMESPDEITALKHLVPQLLLNLPDDAFTDVLGSLSPEAIKERVHRLRADIESGSPRAEMQAGIDPIGLIGQAMRPMAGTFGMEKGQQLGSDDHTLKLIPVVTRQPSLGQADCKAVMEQVAQFKTNLLRDWKGPAPEILVTGRSAYVAQIARSMESDVQVTSMISFAVVTGLFFVGFRRLIPPIGTSIVLGASCVVSFAIGCLIFDNLNMIAIAFCSILVGLGDDFSLLLYNRYLLARNHGEEHEKAISTSIGEVGKGIIYVSVTTAAGFLVLLFSGSSGFAQLGTLIAIGIVCCAVCIILLLFLFIRPQHAHPERPDPLHGLFESLVGLLLNRRLPLGIILSVVALASLAFAFLPIRLLQFDTNPRSLEPKQIPAAVALRTINEKIPAASEPITVLLDAPDAEAAHQGWKTLEQHFGKLVSDGVLRSFSSPAALMLSPAQIHRNRERLKQQVNLEESRQAFADALLQEGFTVESFRFALVLFDRLKAASETADAEINLQGSLPASSSWWFLIDRYLSTRPLLAAAYLRPAMPIDSPEAQVEFERKLRECGVPIKITGWSYTMVGLVPWAKNELVFFSSAVGLLIIISMATAYRAWRPLLVHIGSLAFALGGLVSLLKLTGTQINMLNALAFPLVIGVGVDYGMHVLLAMADGANTREGLTVVIKPLVISGLTTIAGFGALMFAQNPALKGLGTVCALGVTSCLVSSVFFAVPALALFGLRQTAGAPDRVEETANV